jgi:hypothetical protein
MSIRAYVFFFMVFILSATDLYHQHRPAADVFHSNSVQPGFIPSIFLMVYSLAKMKGIGNKAPPCFRPL